MGLADLFSRIADDRRAGNALESAAQTLAGAASPVYTVGAMLNRLLHDTGILSRERLDAPVASIGNITLGGTGKTPFCLWLCDFLRREGYRPAVLTRGYGRADEDALIVVHDGRRLRASTREAGDEPVLLARALGDVPVVACASRHQGGLHALKRLRADALVLDDGFQHHRLHRNLDVVLVDSTQPLHRLRLFPRGSLREPVSTLSRAQLIVLTRWHQARGTRRQVLRAVRAAAPGVPVVRTRLAITGAIRLADRKAVDLESLKGKSAVILCAVGNPSSVRRSAEETGLRVLGMKPLKDHARISKSTLLRYDSYRLQKGADYLVVTEKDAVKLLELGSLPDEVLVLRARIEMLSAEEQETAERLIRARMSTRETKGLLG